MTYKEASKMGDNLRETYERAAYSLTELPLTSPEERADFILNSLPK